MLIKGLSAALLAAMLLAPNAIAGPVNVNTADAKTLARELQGIGMAKAEAIIAHREKNGPFKSADDLVKVKGVGKKLVDQNKANLRFDAEKNAGWKLLFDGRPLLFNVRTDLGERTNLIEQRGDIARRLQPLLAAWQRDVDDEAKRAGAR